MAMTADQTPATPGEIWAILRENARQMQETDRRMQETDRQMQETDRRMQETDRQMQETDRRMQETDRQMQETDRRMQETDRLMKKMQRNLGGLGDSMGKLMEILIAARLWEKFAAYQYNFKRAYRRMPVYDENDRDLTEIDILLLDGEWVMAVEVKWEIASAPRGKIDEIDRHVRRMGLIRKYPLAQTVGKKLLGAVAAGTIEPDMRDKAHEAGFFVIELKGSSAALVPPPEGFMPKEW